jgi:plasmid stabilization system protein ParE
VAKKKIVWTETAAQQRRIILEYWAQHNQSVTYSLRLLEASNEKALRIAAHPLSYRQSEFPDTRVAVLGHFSMFYKVSAEGIVITAFWDNRQDPKKLIELLMKRRS